MSVNYNPSVNIIRDTDKDFNYIPTPNGRRVVSQMVNDFKKGVRSFNMIGSYGTGKSSFLLALEQSLTKKKPYFEPNFVSAPKVDFIKVVGSYQSIIDAFAIALNVPQKQNKTEHILSEIYNRHRDLGKKSPLLFIVIDEFGKFLEYAAQHKPELELYFVQQLAEFANNSDHNIALITTIHQSFESYAFSLPETQKHEWSKIKGRFREIVFNEPVEQLLFLASEHIQNTYQEHPSKKLLDSSFRIFSKSKAFDHNESYSREINDKIFPLDITAANVLTLALQRYGQNERSLFSFLEATDFTSLEKFRRWSSPFYGLPQVYDYLNFNLYSYLISHHNADFALLTMIKRAIEEVERGYDYNVEDYLKIVKTIGLLNIFAAAGSTLDKAFLANYCETCLGIKNALSLVEDLERRELIFYRKHSKRYILFEGTDLNIHTALIEVANRVGEITDIPTLLGRHFTLSPVPAKKYAAEIGTPRYFEFIISEEPFSQVPRAEIDGFINLIFSETLSLRKLTNISSEQQEAVLYCYYRNTKRLKELLLDLEKTNKVLEEHGNDKIARRELEHIQNSQRKLLNDCILNGLFQSNDVVWLWRGKTMNLSHKRMLNGLLSDICKQVYPDTPVFISELVNKHRVSSQIHTARKAFFKALVNNWATPDLGFEPSKFPPEKTLYLTLLKENGLSTYADEVKRELRIKRGSTFTALWNFSNEFLKSAVKEKRNLNDLAERLQQRPFKLKQGFIDIWVPSFLFLRREDFALYGEKGFIPEFTGDTLELIYKNPEEYWIKAFDIAGIRLDIFNSYRIFLNQETQDKLSNKTFIETIKPFLVFYKGLKEYSKETMRLSPEAVAIRNAIVKAQDPEQTFFEDFPAALGTSLSELQSNKNSFHSYIKRLQDAIRELRTSLDALTDRFELFIQESILYEACSFEVYKKKLQNRYKKLKKHLLLPHQVRFVTRLDSPIDERNAWLSSLAKAIVDRSLEQFRDEDELLLYEKFKSTILELDSLTELSKADVDDANEDILGLRFDSFIDGIKQSLVRIPKNRQKEVDSIKAKVQSVLDKDDTLNIAALAKAIKEIMKNG